MIIVDDNPLFRTSVRFLARNTQYVELVGEFETGLEALNSLPQLNPDVVLVDLYMPGMDGISLIRLIREKYPQLQIIAITGSMDSRIVKRVLNAGARQVVFKEKFVTGIFNALPQLRGTSS
jgi:DNA-binding NarL/FixJ family response regulator